MPNVQILYQIELTFLKHNYWLILNKLENIKNKNHKNGKSYKHSNSQRSL